MLNNHSLKFKLKGDDFQRDFLIKALAVKRNHPYHRLISGTPSSLNRERFRSQADKYIRENYFADRFNLVLLTNFDDSDDSAKTELTEKIRAMLSKIPTSISKHATKDTYYPIPLPFKEGARLLVTKSKDDESLLFKIQVKTDYETEAQYEPLLFIKFALNKLLREHLSEQGLMSRYEIFVNYHSKFAILNVKIHLTEGGKSKVSKLIGNVISGLKYLRQLEEKHEHYKNFAEELQSIYNTKPIMSSRQITELLSSRLTKFGPYNTFRATETLNEYKSSTINSILDQALDPNNWLIVLSGTFSIQTGLTKKLDIESAFNSRITQLIDMSTGEKVPGSIILNQIHDESGGWYYLQDLSFQDTKLLSDGPKYHAFVENPYAISKKNFTSMSRSSEETNTRGDFSISRNSIGKGNVFFYRVNNLFNFPMVYVHLKFSISELHAMNFNDMQKANKLMLITEAWKHRLRKIQNYVMEYNGEVDAAYDHGLITLHLYTSAHKINTLVDDVIRTIETSKITEDDYREAKERLFLKLESEIYEHKNAQRQVVSFVQKGAYLDAHMLSFTISNYKNVSSQPAKMNLVFGFVEGGVSAGSAFEIYSRIADGFSL